MTTIMARVSRLVPIQELGGDKWMVFHPSSIEKCYAVWCRNRDHYHVRLATCFLFVSLQLTEQFEYVKTNGEEQMGFVYSLFNFMVDLERANGDIAKALDQQ